MPPFLIQAVLKPLQQFHQIEPAIAVVGDRVFPQEDPELAAGRGRSCAAVPHPAGGPACPDFIEHSQVIGQGVVG